MGKLRFVECPDCGAREARSERMRGLREHCLAIFGFYAFRCSKCYLRFVERPMDLAAVRYAKCPNCLRMDLSTWDPKYYRTGSWTEFRLWLGAYRWRCEPCRKNFVSWRLRRQKYVRPEAAQAEPDQARKE